MIYKVDVGTYESGKTYEISANDTDEAVSLAHRLYGDRVIQIKEAKSNNIVFNECYGTINFSNK